MRIIRGKYFISHNIARLCLRSLCLLSIDVNASYVVDTTVCTAAMETENWKLVGVADDIIYSIAMTALEASPLVCIEFDAVHSFFPITNIDTYLVDIFIL